MKRRYYIYFLALLLIFLKVNTLQAAIDSVDLTIDKGTVFGGAIGSGGAYYYIPDTEYTFTINVEISGTAWTSKIYDVSLKIPDGSVSGFMGVNINYITGPCVDYVLPGGNCYYGTAKYSVASGDYGNFIITIKFTPNSAYSTFTEGVVASRIIMVTVQENYGPNSTISSTHTYGLAKTGLTGPISVTTGGKALTLVGSDPYYIGGTPVTSTTTPNSADCYHFVITGTANGHNALCLQDIELSIETDNPLKPILFQFTPGIASGTQMIPNDINHNERARAVYAWSGNTYTIRVEYIPSANISAINTGYLTGRKIEAKVKSKLFPSEVTSFSPGSLSKNYGIISQAIDSVVTRIVRGPNTSGFETKINGDPYFFPNKQYEFEVEVTTAALVTSWDFITNVRLYIANGPTLSINPSTVGPGLNGNNSATTTALGAGTVDVTIDEPSPSSTPWRHFIVKFSYSPAWARPTSGPTSVASLGYFAGNNNNGTITNRRYIRSSAVFLGTAETFSTDELYAYGICSSPKVVLIADGTAAGGYVNPWDEAFNLTGYIVYNVPTITNTTSSTVIETPANNCLIPLGTTGVGGPPTLVYSHYSGFTTTTIANDSGLPNNKLKFEIPAKWFSTNGKDDYGTGYYYWGVRTTFGGTANTNIYPTATNSPFTPYSTLCGKLEIYDMEFRNGDAGQSTIADKKPYYYRNIYTPGTQVRFGSQVKFRINASAFDYRNPIPASGSGTITFGYNYGTGPITTTIPVTFPGTGAGWSEWADIINPTDAYVPLGNTQLTVIVTPPPPTFYYVTKIVGNMGNRAGFFGGEGQYISVRIEQTSPTRIYWDNEDPPGSETGKFTSWVSTGTPKPETTGGKSSGTYSVELKWTNIPMSAHPSRPDGDFYTYRIYYRTTGSQIWSVIDRNTSASPLHTALGNDTTNTYKLTKLLPMFSYEYYLTALDIWGNETKLANRSHGGSAGAPWHAIGIPAAAFSVEISDGYGDKDFGLTKTHKYDDADFDTDSPPFTNISDRQLFPSAIKVDVLIENSGQPDQMSIILKDFTVPGDFVTSGVLNGTEGTNYYKIPLSKVASNRWQGFIPSENPLIAQKKRCRFILEAVKSGGKIYMDYDIHKDTIPNPNNYPWTFEITNSIANTKPWPTKVLNNVITDKNPVSYPSYYLTDDAYVTIIAYDLKGRSVAMLLDNVPRPKGQNIKENGWHGTGKTGKKLGVGLYYVHIKAVRQSDGKVLIDKYNKVVMAR